jgi:hypothetical protein
LRITSSIEETRSSINAYCSTSIVTDPAVARASTRQTDRSHRNLIGPKNPSAARSSRLPTIPIRPIVGMSANGSRLTEPTTRPAMLPGTIVNITPGTVP